MSESKRSFWASIPGLVTGIAGLLTGIVGLVTVLIQLDVLGSDDAGTPTAGVTTTVAGRAPAAGDGVTTTVSGRLTAQPSPIKLQPGERAKEVSVRNASTAAVTVLEPEYTGPDSGAFSTDGGCTGVNLRPGASCTMKVTLTPTGTLKTYRASLVLEANEIPQVTEVPVEASTIL